MCKFRIGLDCGGVVLLSIGCFAVAHMAEEFLTPTQIAGLLMIWTDVVTAIAAGGMFVLSLQRRSAKNQLSGWNPQQEQWHASKAPLEYRVAIYRQRRIVIAAFIHGAMLAAFGLARLYDTVNSGTLVSILDGLGQSTGYDAYLVVCGSWIIVLGVLLAPVTDSQDDFEDVAKIAWDAVPNDIAMRQFSPIFRNGLPAIDSQQLQQRPNRHANNSPAAAGSTQQ